METITEKGLVCTHCGEACREGVIRAGEGIFCCQGCRMVYELLNSNGLCTYYQLNEHPGINRKVVVRKDKFAFLDDSKVAEGLIVFQNEGEAHVQFYLPQIHCSSCLYLLEQLHRLEEGVISSRVDFAARQVLVIFDRRRISLRGVAELLTAVGYEPHISLRDWGHVQRGGGKGLIYQLGVAGFCFANIMLLSFPEYLGLDGSDPAIMKTFRYLNLLVSLPVVLYSARPFYISAWKGLRSRFLNIDAPIVLAILVTFGRSMWEVCTGSGSGYFDSMSGIVFFMLAGRVLQDRTYRQLSFDRDYTSYFPVAVTLLQTDKETGEERELVRTIPDIRSGDTLKIHSGELIPADGILTRGQALIDYSFVTGESEPVEKQMGELVYAGGRQVGGAIEILVVREVAQSYLTQLWNRHGDREGKGRKGSEGGRRRSRAEGDFSFVHPLSRYFTYIVLSVAAGAAVYWGFHDPGRVWNAVTAVLIVACPCALLLSSTFTNGNLLRVFGRHQFYLKNAEVIERIARTDHIVFDKTGTLTEAGRHVLQFMGEPLTEAQQSAVATLASQSGHPLSRALASQLSGGGCSVLGFRELPGLGIEGFVGGVRVALGSLAFLTAGAGPVVGGSVDERRAKQWNGGEEEGSRVYVSFDYRLMGYYSITNHYRDGLSALVRAVRGKHTISVLSGDDARERRRLQELLGEGATLRFAQTPMDKADYIEQLQREGHRVMMVGDGLNDAGALEQSDAGIAVTEDCNNFTPSSDAILRADQLNRLPVFIRLCRAGKTIILISFILSILYNLIGLSFAVAGLLSPMVAAILMPSSSLTILLVTYGCSNLAARRLRL